MGYLTHGEVWTPMGGKPNQGTKKDKRLKENKKNRKRKGLGLRRR